MAEVGVRKASRARAPDSPVPGEGEGCPEPPGQTKNSGHNHPDRVGTLKESNDSHQLTKATPKGLSSGRDSRFGLVGAGKYGNELQSG
jgi:hypothetical protein